MAGEHITDIIVIGIVLVSGLLALARGLIKEVFSIISWGGAVLVTIYAFTPVRPLVKDIVPWPDAEVPATVIILFFGSLIVFSLASSLVSKLIQSVGAGVIDRTLGFVFGLARGALIAIVLFVGVGWYLGPKDQPAWFRNARTVPLAAIGANYLMSLTPEGIRTSLPKIVMPEKRTAPERTGKQSLNETPGYRSGDRQDLQRLIEGATQAK